MAADPIIQTYLNDSGIDLQKRQGVLNALKAGQSEQQLSQMIFAKYPDRYAKVQVNKALEQTAGHPMQPKPQDTSVLGGILGGGLLGGQNKSTPVGNFIQNKALPQIQDSISREGGVGKQVMDASQGKPIQDPAYNVGKQFVEGVGNTLGGVGKVAYAPFSAINPLDTRTMEQKSETGIEGLNQIIGGVGQTVMSPLAASPTAQTLVSLPFEAAHDTLSGALQKLGVDTESQHGKNIVDSALNGILLAIGGGKDIVEKIKTGELTSKDAWEQVKQTGDMAKEIPYMAKDAMKGGKASWVDKNVISPIAAEAGKMSPETTRMAMENPKLLTAAQKEGVVANRAKTFEMAKKPLDEKIGGLEKEFEMNKQRTFEQAKGALDTELQNLEHTGKGYEPIRQSQSKVKLTEESAVSSKPLKSGKRFSEMSKKMDDIMNEAMTLGGKMDDMASKGMPREQINKWYEKESTRIDKERVALENDPEYQLQKKQAIAVKKSLLEEKQQIRDFLDDVIQKNKNASSEAKAALDQKYKPLLERYQNLNAVRSSDALVNFADDNIGANYSKQPGFRELLDQIENPSMKPSDQESIKNEFLNADEVNMSDAQLLQKMKEYEQRTKQSSYTVEGKKYKKTNSDLMADEKGRARIAAYFDEVERSKTSTGAAASSNWVENFFQKKGLKIKNGKIIANSESAIRSPGEIARVQHLYDTYAKKTELASSGFLNLRKDVGGLSKFGEGITTDMTSFAKDFYSEINAKGRPQIKGLKELDEKYAPLKKNLQDAKKLIYDKEGMLKPDAYENVTKAIAQGKPGVVAALKKVIPEFDKFMEEAQKNTTVKSELKQFKQLIYDTDGNIKPNAISEINNLFNKGKEGKLERMKEIMPDFEEFQKQVKITKALEDIEASKAARTGFYKRAAGNTTSAALGYAVGNIPGAVIGTVLHNIMTNPTVILETLKKYGEVKISTARLIKDISETVNSGKKLTPAQTKFLMESASLYQKEKE